MKSRWHHHKAVSWFVAIPAFWCLFVISIFGPKEIRQQSFRLFEALTAGFAGFLMTGKIQVRFMKGSVCAFAGMGLFALVFIGYENMLSVQGMESPFLNNGVLAQKSMALAVSLVNGSRDDTEQPIGQVHRERMEILEQMSRNIPMKHEQLKRLADIEQQVLDDWVRG